VGVSEKIIRETLEAHALWMILAAFNVDYTLLDVMNSAGDLVFVVPLSSSLRTSVAEVLCTSPVERRTICRML